MKRNTIINGDVIETLATFPDECIDCVVTSPPYWGLRDYGVPGQIGLEPTLDEFIARLTQVFHDIKRVLKPDGTLWLNMGDAYATQSGTYGGDVKYKGLHAKNLHNATNQKQRKPKEIGLKHKDLIGQPWRLAFALQADGWYLRSDIIWSKPNPMPESVTDRPTKAHEYVFLMSKQPRYYYDADAVRENYNPATFARRQYPIGNTSGQIGARKPGGEYVYDKTDQRKPLNEGGRNRRTVWEIATQPMPDAHFATFPEKLVEPCVLAGTSERGYCSECGKPWGRVVETEYEGSKWGKKTVCQYEYGGYMNSHGTNLTKKNITLGWEAGCNCNADTVPGLVLDPFMGSGTVALVAHRLDRDFIGIELSTEYCEIAHKRIDEKTSQGRLFTGGQ